MKNILKSLGYLFYYVLFQMITMSLIASCFAATSAVTDPVEINDFVNRHALVFTILSNLLSLFFLFLIFRLRGKNFAQEIGFRKVNIHTLILPVFGAFCFSMAFALVTYHMSFTNAGLITDSNSYLSGIFPGLGTMVQVAALLIVSPLAEETIFRGLILTRLQRSFPDLAAILLSGFLFGIIHAAAGGIVLIIGAAIMGIIFGVISVKTKSLLPAILAHTAANVADFVIALLPELSRGIQYALIAVFLLMFAVVMGRFLKQSDM